MIIILKKLLCIGGENPKIFFPSVSDVLPLFFSPLSPRIFFLLYMFFHHLSLVNNALPTSRRMRHQNHIDVQDVATCFFCMKGEDSFSHECIVVSNARACFFRNSRYFSFCSHSPLSPPLSFSSSPSNFSECIFPRKIHSCRLKNFLLCILPSSPLSSDISRPRDCRCLLAHLF